MEKQLEILNALLDGKKVYDDCGREVALKGDITVPVCNGLSWLTYLLHELNQFTLTPPRKPLTFERIKKECVSGKHLFRFERDGREMHLGFIGFNRNGGLVTDFLSGDGAQVWYEREIANWTIEEYKREE